MKQIPNCITLLRIFLTIALFFFIQDTWVFIFIYICCGISDILDGYIARRYKLSSAFGAKLDSIADFIFFVTSILLFIIKFQLQFPLYVIICFIVIFLIRIANLVITKIKFKQWGMFHTIGNKISGLLLFLILPIGVLINYFPDIPVIILGATALLSALEEMLILQKMTTYNADTKSLFGGK
ncbi:CDP-alcohol phosphatidyltransferase family protein [Culicoidibacter larvae]|uniref:Phosphatidylglycerophosphate synthase n=1 Tax=Culicoidibacter larvae TaxID=2579976 RepID=A0A5R8QGK8_9FIRM|nr:CDP-alcohol phosphatidyltransferase family protein [Culicoidibacter larvae]TLG77128.1 CDP-alcohol phosphatidyltransferase family protein [Culicoidibacter larvae]